MKPFFKKIFNSRFFLFIFAFALIILIVGVSRESYRKYQLTKEIDQLNSAIEQIEGRNIQLAELMDSFKKDSYLEKEARLKLNLKKPGETVVVLPEFSSEEEIKVEEKEIKEKEYMHWEWWEYFFSPN